MHLNDTAGCLVHRGIDFQGHTIGGECCKAKDTFQLCTGSISNTSELVCVNASSVSLSSGTVTISAPLTAVGAYTSVRYAYANYPQCALYNAHGLPAGPFVVSVTTADKEPPVEGDATVTSTKATTPEPPAVTPPMGVNTWNAFHCNVDERKVRAMADALITTGLAKSGYEFVVSVMLCCS